MYIFSDFSKFIFYFLTYIEEECYSVVILAKSSALFHAKIFQTPCSNFFARSGRKAPTFSLYKGVGTYVMVLFLYEHQHIASEIFCISVPLISKDAFSHFISVKKFPEHL